MLRKILFFHMTHYSRIIIMASILCLAMACQAELEPFDIPHDMFDSQACEPLFFESPERARSMINNGLITKSENFISFKDAVMSKDGYDDTPNAIFSEKFGEILNADGEVYIGNYLLKLTEFGFLCAERRYEDLLREYGSKGFSSSYYAKSSSFPMEVNNPSRSYSTLDGCVFFYDSFDMIEHHDASSIASLLTKNSSYVVYEYDEVFSAYHLGHNYSYPLSDEKHTFPSYPNIANDTKIYREDLVFYQESGVKTKTMKKIGIIWNKFTNYNASGFGAVIIQEYTSGEHVHSTGWLDINETSYSGGGSFMIATKKVSGIPYTPSASVLDSDFNSAISWASTQGISLSGNDLDGVRYLFNDGCYTFLRDHIVAGVDEKQTIFFNVDYQGTFTASPSSLNNMAIYNSSYIIKQAVFWGHSIYNGEVKGSRVFFHD